VLAYLEDTPKDWSRAVAGTWQIEDRDDRVRIWGLCPTCEHPSESVFEALRTTMGPGDRQLVVVACACTQPHPDRPEGKDGCGRAGWVEIDLGG